MTAAAIQRPEPYEVPEGGLGSFLTATVGDWSDEALNADNYYDVVKPTADQLAQFGREEDDRIAHVATGETIIPMAVFEEDPALKEALFSRMRDMGIDPERYIVGNELNSINPVTGQPEFFLKKIFKGIKKAVKGVVKVFKKVAPIVLSIGLSMTPLGPILGTALGSGIGTLIQGGDLKDALKAAAIGGITAGVTSGISNVVKAQIPGGSPGGTFMEGVTGALPDFDKISSTFSPATASTTAPTAFTPEEIIAQLDPPDPRAAGMLASTTDPAVALGGQQGVNAAAAANATKPLEEVLVTAPRIQPQTPVLNTAQAAAASGVADRVLKSEATRDLKATDKGPPEYRPSSSDTIFEQMQERQKLTNALRRGDLKEAFMPRSYTAEDILRIKGIDPFAATTTEVQRKAAEAIAKRLSPKLLRQYGPAFLGIAGLGAATGAFEEPELEPLEGGYGMTGMDLLIANPLQYRTYAQAGSGYNPPPVGVAGGGGMDTRSFPRRDGAIRGPGTETSDDIPAMLSDGEFVMTARAVRGAGNGSRERGMRRMYDMMSQFERAV